MAQINLCESETRKLYEAWSSSESFVIPSSRLSDNERYAVKVDETISGRFKKGLIVVNVTKKGVEDFILTKKKEGYEEIIVEPYILLKDEKYVSFETYPDYDLVRYTDFGGVDVESNWSGIKEMKIDLLFDLENITFPTPVIKSFYKFFVSTHFAFLEINPYGYVGEKLFILDFKARIDSCGGNFLRTVKQGLTAEEEYIESIAKTTSASLKLKMLNPNGRVWPMIAGGGASMLYFDLINEKFASKEVAFYGEYSGNPSVQLLYKYALTIINLMVKSLVHNKILVIGGGNANFTYIPDTFKAIIQALQEHINEFVKQDITVIVRRAGPYDVEGLTTMSRFLKDHKIKHFIYGIGTPIEETFSEYMKISYDKCT